MVNLLLPFSWFLFSSKTKPMESLPQTPQSVHSILHTGTETAVWTEFVDLKNIS